MLECVMEKSRVTSMVKGMLEVVAKLAEVMLLITR